MKIDVNLVLLQYNITDYEYRSKKKRTNTMDS